MNLGRHAFTPSELAAQLQADRAGDPYLLLRDGRAVQRLIPLTSDVALVGREPGLDLVIAWDEQVSRLHARLERVGGTWTVLDDGLSRNGTFVGVERVTGRRRLQHGDRVRFGQTETVFRNPAERPADTVPALVSSGLALTDAQRLVLSALCAPLLRGEPVPASNAEVAAALHLSVETVRTHLKALFVRLDVPDLPQNRKRVELARRAVAFGLEG